MGVAIEYENNRESIPVIQDLSRLEYDLTSAIRRLTRAEKPTAGFWTDHGEPDLMQNMPLLQQNLATNYNVQAVTGLDLQSEDRPDVLVIVAPTDTIPEPDLRALDSYIMEGGRVGFLLNRVAANLQSGQAVELFTGLEPLLANYGIVLMPNLIMDEQSSVVNVQRRQGFFQYFAANPVSALPGCLSFQHRKPDGQSSAGYRFLLCQFCRHKRSTAKWRDARTPHLFVPTERPTARILYVAANTDLRNIGRRTIPAGGRLYRQFSKCV